MAAEIGYQFLHGRPEAVRAITDRVRQIITYRGFGIPTVDRQDLEQEVMTQLWHAVKRPDFEHQTGFLGFVDAVSTRRCIDWYRRSKHQPQDLDEGMVEKSAGPLARTLSKERIELVNQALSSLGEGCWELLELRVQKRLSFAEISRRLNRSPGALRVQLHRCVRRAREEISLLRSRGPRQSRSDR